MNQSPSQNSRRKRRGRRRGVEGGDSQASAPVAHHRRVIVHREPLAKLISDDELEAIHQASLTILSEIGIEVLSAEAREILSAAGAQVDGERVRFGAALIDSALASVPSQFTLHARNPVNNMLVGGNRMYFGSVASAPNCSDLDHGRRTGNVDDYQKFLKLIQSLDVVHYVSGYPVEPVDIHSSVRHLHCLRDCVTLTDKVFHCYSLGRERNLDALEIVRIARNIDSAQLEREPSLFTVINTSSPLRLDEPMAIGIIEMSRHGQVVVLTPFTLAGAMAPVTLAGAIAQQNAEALAGLVLSQCVRPGAPFVYGGFTSNVDMRSGSPAFGTPEYMQAVIVGAQLARRYRIPCRSSNVNAANSVDAQSAYESVFSLWAVANSGVHMVLHAAGWLEGGLCASFEKMIVDADLLRMLAQFQRPLTIDQDTLALDAVRDVGPGGHYFGTAHTQDRYRTAFYEPLVSDWRNFESWQQAGSPDAAQHANRVYKELLERYRAPALAPAVAQELDEFVNKRVEAGGVATDF